MKKLLLVVVLTLIAGSTVFAANYTFDQFQAAFQDFANGAASALPLESSVGLNWSDAYIGQFPHFGIGVTVGAATIPYAAMNKAITTFVPGGLPSDYSFLKTLGVPVPAYTVDLRIGGFGLPFDFGFKFGYLPPNALSSISKVSADYLLLGGDIRYALVKDQGWAPAISIGVGYTYMRGNVFVPGILPSGQTTISSVSFGGTTHTIGFTNPSLNVFWNSNVIDAKIQLSKSLLIITPYIGLGASYGISNAGGGMQSQMTIDGNPATPTQLDQINKAFNTNFTFENQGFGVNVGANGVSTRAFGGLSINLFFLRLGVGAEYEFLSGSFAGMANVRLQF